MLALVGEAYGAGGGIAQFNRDYFGALDRLGGWRIQVSPRYAQQPDFSVPQRVRQTPPTPGKVAYAARAIVTALRLRPDVVFCGHLFMAPLAAFIARFSNAKLLIQVHGIEGWSRPNAAVRHAARRADLIACVSRDTRARVLAWIKRSPDALVVLPNTVAEEFVPGDRDAARLAWSVQDRFTLLTVGRLDSRERYKGQDRVIALLASLCADRRDLMYLIAGEGDDRARLEELARVNGVSDQVRFLGAVNAKELASLYQAADLFVLPSTGEGFGIVYLEAMASGTPAIGLALGGAPDALADGELGACVSEAEFPAALASALRMPPRSGESLANEVRERFGIPTFTGRVADVMSNLLSRAAR